MPRFLLFFLLLLPACSNMLDGIEKPAGFKDTKPRGSFVISNNDDYVYSCKTMLNIDIVNASEMRFMNDSGAWGEWEALSAEKEWVLELSNGERIVYGEFRDEDGDILSVSDASYLQERVIASNGRSGDGFGSSVAVSEDGMTVVVGAPGDNRDRLLNLDGYHDDQGAVYVYTWEDNEWNESIIKTTGYEEDYFGCSVSISGDGSRIAAGAYRAASDDPENAAIDNRGAVYVFDRDVGGEWPQSRVFYGEDESWFGYSVFISGDGSTIIAGAPRDGSDTEGKTYASYYTGGSWSGMEELVPDVSLENGDLFGYSVAVSEDGTAALAGAPGVNTMEGNDAGMVCLFSGSGGTWEAEGEFYLSFPSGYDEFGISVSMSADGNVWAAGAEGHEYGSNTRQGTGYIYRNNGTEWSCVEIFPAYGSDYDYFGNSIAVGRAGDIIIAGSSLDDRIYGDQGSAFIYLWDGAAYNILLPGGELYSPEGGYQDKLGFSVSVSSDGSIVAAGSCNDDIDHDGQGAVYIFRQ